MNNNVKMAINMLQNHIVSCTTSDNILLIFDNTDKLNRYKNNHKHICPNELLTTIDEITYSNFLTGRRYKAYWFMRDEDIEGDGK